jgi:peptidoglycan/LPS O-acetylase OafA/YrhL
VLQTEEPIPQAREGARALGYVPALDGLRALAVMAVLLYHAGVGWMTGGYLGVDLFFVLSGFLITRLLLDEWASSGRIDLVGFWRRRAARLLPAVAVLLAVCPLVFRDRSRLGGDVLATAAYVANWRLVFGDVSYFQQFEAPSPLQHTWSLAIEEQWYVVWPVVVALGAALLRTRRGRVVATAVVVAALAASALAMRAFADDPTRAYYGTDTRVQALLAGVVVALVVAPQVWGWRVRNPVACAAVGLVGLGWLAVTVDGAPRWMLGGGFTLAAAFGALGVAGVASGAGVVGDVLSRRLPVAVGRLSYSLYLWHWPVYLWLTPDRTDLDGTALVVVRIAASFVVALASFALIEQPIRLKRAFRPVVVLAAVCVPVVLVGVARLDDPPRDRFALTERSGAVTALEGATSTTAPVATTTPDTGTRADAPGPATTVVPPVAAPTTAPPDDVDLVLFGDSVGATFFDNLRDDSLPFPASYIPVGRLGCGIMDGYAVVPGEPSGLNDDCLLWPGELEAAVDAVDPDVVLIMIGAWEVFDTVIDGVRLDVGTPEHAAAVERRLRQAVGIAGADGAHVVLFDVPCFDEPERELGGEVGRPRNDPDRVAAVNAIFHEVATEEGITILPYHDLVCADNEPRDFFGGTDVRPDGVHFPMGVEDSPEARFVWEWVGQQLLDRELVDPT